MTIRALGKHIRSAFQVAKRPQMFVPDVNRDTFLVSYPRSGNTWLRVMISQLMTTKTAESLAVLDYIIPDTAYDVPTSKMPDLPFYVIKTHQQLRIGSSTSKYRKVIYIVRDPRDVAVSYHRFLLNNGHKVELHQFVSQFVCGRIFPGSWQEHVENWTYTEGISDECQILVLKYEDMLRTPSVKLKEIAQFLNIPATDAEVAAIVDQSSRKQMIDREKAGYEDSNGSHLYFIGNCKSGNWADHLSVESADEICRFAESTMRRFGYL